MKENRIVTPKEEKSIFFLGIGGISMCSLAALAAGQGKRVGGCDRTESEITAQLRAQGICLYPEAAACAVLDYDRVVYTLAAPPQHPVLELARRHGIPCESRADYLGRQLLHYPIRIGVAGSHGKSSTTAMLGRILQQGGREPTVLCGANMHDFDDRPYRIGGADTVLFEACEYRDAFLSFSPTCALLLNLEHDHVDYFADTAQLGRSFAAFAQKAEQTVYCADDKALCEALQDYRGKRITFSLGGEADYTATEPSVCGTQARFTLCEQGRAVARICLRQGGIYNVKNALAAAACARAMGVGIGSVVAGLQGYGGIGRRMEYVGALGDTAVYSDYAHHPTEVRSALCHAALLAKERAGRVLCVFQSHTYSRSQAFLADFIQALSRADVAWILPVYAARETQGEHDPAALLARAIHAPLLSDFNAVLPAVKKEAQAGDVLLLMGAGDVDRLRFVLCPKKG